VLLQNIAPVVAALAGSTLVVDCTVEGLMHAPELPAILKGNGSSQPRVVYVSNEHPEALARLLPDDTTEPLVKDHVKRLRGAKAMQVTSAAGTHLQISLQGAVVGGNWGTTTRPGTMTHWPGGLVLAFPAAGSVNGTLVLAEGDVNLTFKRYIERPITLTIENDHVTRIEGSGVDAELMRSYIAAWSADPSDRAAYAVSHVGYGLNAAARWDSMALYDKRDFNGTELRAFAGNFLYSTGANEVAGRYTAGHFDLPLRHAPCSSMAPPSSTKAGCCRERFAPLHHLGHRAHGTDAARHRRRASGLRAAGRDPGVGGLPGRGLGHARLRPQRTDRALHLQGAGRKLHPLD
jgi:2,5-dihydroxypyridine 5,6-dioxygenase